MARKHFVIIDGFSFLFRAYHAVRMLNRASDDMPVNALYGFAQMLTKVVTDLKPDLCAVALDAPGDTFRHELYPEYKANRSEMDEEMKVQMPYFEPLIESFGIPAVKLEGVEADDIIATLVKTHKGKFDITIVSSDKDLMQLLDDNVVMLDTMKNKTMAAENVAEKFGVGPELVTQVQALIGDSSDNIPGVKSVGPKTAAQLIGEFGSLDGIYNNLDNIKREKLRNTLSESKELAYLSYQLVCLKGDVVVPVSDSDIEFNPDLSGAAKFLLEELELKSLASRLSKLTGMAGEPSNGVEQKTKSVSYYCVDEKSELDTWIERCRKAGKFAIDTETNSLYAMNAELVGISLAVEEGEACYIPLSHKSDGSGQMDLLGETGQQPSVNQALKQLDKSYVLEKLKPLLADSNIKKIGQNIKYDLIVLHNAGISEVNGIEDTMVMSFCLDGGKHGHGMDALALTHLNHVCIAYKDVAGVGKKQVTFDYVPLEKAVPYAAEDADITLRLYNLFSQRLSQEGLEKVKSLYEDIERPLIQTLVAMEMRGALVDAAKLNDLSDEFGKRMRQYEERIFELAGEPFNINSPKQLGDILFNKLGLSIGKKKTVSTNAVVLEKLAEDGHEIASEVLAYRSVAKLRSTYTESLQECVNPKTGRVHTSYNQTGAATGRFSSSDPNLQNIPIRSEDGRKIRRAFISRPGWVLMAADYSQIELRLLAHMSGSEGLKQAFLQGRDVHAHTAHQIFDVPIEEVTSDQRRVAKMINFGLVYGMGSTSLGKNLGISRNDAADYIERYFTRYAGVREYMDENKNFCREYGFVETLLGRRVHLPNVFSNQPMLKAGAERAAINAPLQGSNADIIKKVMPHIESELKAKGFKAEMLMQVHDELVFEVPESELEQVKELVTSLMQNVVKISVPLKVDAGTGQNWEDAH